MHKALFWVAMAVLQLDEVNLYSAGTALLEQNLHTLDSLRVFNDKVSKPSASNQLWLTLSSCKQLVLIKRKYTYIPYPSDQ